MSSPSSMQSESFSFRKTIRRILPSSNAPHVVDNPVLSGTIREYGAVTNNAIQASLAALKEASSLASKVPYIAPIAGLLLQALTMRDEVKQYKQECEVVMRKLNRVASLVVNVGESCQTYNLNEGDLPAGLRAILKSLQMTSELSGIEHVLKDCAKTRGVKGLLFRKDLLGKIKQYDGELSNVLQAFQAELSLDIRFALIVEGRDAVRTATTEIATFTARAPPAPQIFFGRDAELAQIIDVIFTNIGVHPARVAILGPGGYGKTTLANAVLTHGRILEHFHDAIYFVACESVTSSGALLIELGKTLGILQGTPDVLWSHIHATLNAKESILCFDNFESPWDQPDGIKQPVEELLSRVTELHQVTVLITMRGAERPAQTKWTKPFLELLKTLDHDAAQETWEEIAGNHDEFSDKLIAAVDYVPLAVNLLAHLSQVTSPQLLWEEWNSKQTKLIKRGEMHRLSNLEYSIQLSVDSERMRANPSANNLLGVLSMLPNGIHNKQVGKFKAILVDLDVMACLQVLQQCSLIQLIGERYQPHPIIRQFCNDKGFISFQDKVLLEEFYIGLASINVQEALPETYAEMLLEVNNTKAAFDRAEAVYQKALQIHEASNDILGQGQGHYGLGQIYTDLNKLSEAEASYQKALECHRAVNNVVGQGNDYQGLGLAYLVQDKLAEAEASFQKALEFQKLANHIINQGNAHQGLGHVYIRQNRLDEAKASYNKAIELHEAANSILNEGNDYQGLGDAYLQVNDLDAAERSYQKALELARNANNAVGHGLAFRGLGRLYMERSQLDNAKTMFEEALNTHRQVQAKMWEEDDQAYLNEVLTRMKEDPLE
ncbi:hypothetical protein B0F90DRAFT_1919675 [Multifurca ochricompacta]|uniref:NB-ARC domain-containing protein n=1 Tax=Multifurca ochricompacta TaxID=376703 RepID=A0AAD4LYF2_9AGAM|nr:hypothetical protein B0F90DRAFT_1919675 [Multifurca ochricompacta]